MSEHFLRPEAGPVPFDKLQKRAKGALENIIGTLSAAVGSAKASSEETSADMNRASRIFFVSGEPGSGKSTLYLTLKEMLNDKDEKYSKGYKDKGGLSNLRGAVRWLDTLDLEVAGDEGENLLAAVLVRLIDELTKSGVDSNTVVSNPCEGAIKDLEELATDIGIAWEGNLQARAGELDPDTFSEEVMRTQRARLGINERLKKALNELAKNRCYSCRENTLFILPVDDFYLKPDASLHLLRLLRMISIPRLFFLVMGDIKTVEALFVEKSLADWTAVAGARIFAARTDRLDEALARARELRARYLRKLLPPGQRAMIEAMDWDEALKFAPERLNGKEFDVGMLGDKTLEDGTLKSLLKKRNLDSSVRQSAMQFNLLTFLTSPAFDNETKQGELSEEGKKLADRKKKAREAYTALQLLDATSREIMDLWFALYELLNNIEEPENPTPKLLSRVIEFVKLEIEEQNFLNEKEHGSLLAVLPTRHYTEQEIYLDMNRLMLEPEPSTWRPMPTNQEQGGNNKAEAQLWLRKHRSWKLAVNTDEGNSHDDSGLFAKLPPRQTAWIVLLHDLTCEWNPERVNGNLVEELYKRLTSWSPSKKMVPPNSKAGLLSTKDKGTEIVKLSAQQLIKLAEIINGILKGADRSIQEQDLTPSEDFPGWAVWQSGSDYHHFPMPDFSTFRDIDRFLYVWSKGLEWFDDLEKQAKAAQQQAREARKRLDNSKPQSVGDGAVQSSPTTEDVQRLAKDSEAERFEKDVKEAESTANILQRRVEGDAEQMKDKFLSLWALAGWTVFTETYENFATLGDDWFEKFDVITADARTKRFTEFEKMIPDFQYPNENTLSQITSWLGKIDNWPNPVNKSSETSASSPDTSHTNGEQQ